MEVKGYFLSLSSKGQAVLEFALVAPILMLLVFGVIDFGIMFEHSIAVTNAARDGVRWAVTHPTAWSNANPAPSSTIEGQIQTAGGVSNIPNNDQTISISYWVPSSSGGSTECGYYSASSNSFVALNGYTESTCVIPGNLIKVSIHATYNFITPIFSALYPQGISISSSAIMMEEV